MVLTTCRVVGLGLRLSDHLIRMEGVVDVTGGWLVGRAHLGEHTYI